MLLLRRYPTQEFAIARKKYSMIHLKEMGNLDGLLRRKDFVICCHQVADF